MSKALIAAIDANDPEAVRSALKGIKDINRKLPGTNKPLLYACEKGADQVLEILFEAGAIAERRNTDPWETPFAVAAKHGQEKVLERLWALKQASKKAVESVLHMAAMEGDEATLEMALRIVKPQINTGLFRLGSKPKNASQILKLLIQHGGDVNGRYNTDRGKRRTPLHELVGGAKPDVIQTLVEAGADVNAPDSLGRTPLMVLASVLEAIESDKAHAEMIRRLKAIPGNTVIGNPQIREGLTAVQTILELRADATLIDNEGNDALDHCMFAYWRRKKEPDVKILETLRDAGAKGSKVTMELFDAIQKQNVESVRTAIEAGADVNRLAPESVSMTPLTSASFGSDKSVEVVQVLLKAGANPNKYDENSTPLIRAARSGNLAVVKELVAAGANIHAMELRDEDEFLENAYSAAQGDHEDVVDYLKSLGATKPKPSKIKPLTPGVESWNDFSELLIKSTVEKAADSLAKMIKGTVQQNVHGQSVKPGKNAYVVVRPKGMDWCNILQVAPPQNRYEDSKKNQAFATDLAKASRTSVLSIEYSDTANAVSLFRAEADGKSSQDAGWDRETLEEMVGALGDKAPEWAKKQLENADEDEPGGTERLVMLAHAERFVVAAFGLDYEPGNELEVDFIGYSTEVFDGVAFVNSR
jgi:ankyrin repeat protein